MDGVRVRRVAVIVWVVVVVAALGCYFLRRDAFQHGLQIAFGLPLFAAGLVYLVVGCLRGFTLIPSTSIVIVALPFLPPWPLFGLTMAGIMVSSASIYFFSEWIGLDVIFERRYPVRLAQLKALLRRRELPIIIAWSFFPLVPTDAICYAAGVLRIDVRKCLLGVLIGEGAICALYIFLGQQALRWFVGGIT
jgi:uncharacterized membrane protein YdjX (TVP38/TMEM64 family)